nr:MAG: hypothetical protein DIU72_10775 [Pseudomonadota bacterium]
MVEGRRTLWLFWGSLAVFLLTAHAAVRSPDAEILFEACDALASRGTFALEPVSAWEGHGVETGRDGRTYSIFGPLVSIACAPLLALIDAIGPLAVFEALGGPPWPSHYVPDGLFQALDGEPPTDLLPHARRALVAWIFNGVVSALAVALFFRVARRFAADERAALSVTVVFALATPTWPYAGTFFAEPLATLLVLAAIERMGLPGAARGLRLAVAGLFAGLAAWAHITAVLFAPFFPFLASLEEGRFRPARALVFGTGLALGLGGLALYHYLLWGDPFETGRYSNYGRFVPPWRGLYGLLLSPGKGLFLHVPVALLGAWAFGEFWRKYRAMGAIFAGALLVRLVFIASRSDWHGGFCVGPRLLLQGMPLLLLPLVPWLDDRIGRRPRAVLAFAFVSLVSFGVQWLFVAGEPFRILHELRLDALAAFRAVFDNDEFYLDFATAPLAHLPFGPVGPYLLRNVRSPLLLWAFGVFSVLLLLGFPVKALLGKGEVPGVPWRERLAPFLLALATAALYVPTLGNDFINLDDPWYVHGSPFATEGWRGILLAFFESHLDAYYPVTHAIYTVVQTLFGTSALAHHAVQVGIFAAGVALLPWALAAFGIPRAVGFWIALLWAAHPMRVESVSWVGNLKDPAAFLGLVLAFGAYGAGWRKTSVAMLALALLAKSAFFPIAGLFVLLERRRAGWERAFVRALPHLAVAATVAAIGAYLHVFPAAAEGRTHPGGSLGAAIPSVLWLPWWYLGRNLTFRYPQALYTFEPVGWLDPRFLVALVAWGGALAVLWKLPREKRLAWGTGLAAWILPFLPVTGLVPLVHHVADRYDLLPSIPVWAGIVLAAREGARRLPRWAAPVAAGSALAVMAAVNLPRQLDYRDSVALWETELPREPNHATVRYLLGTAYANAGRWDDAIAQLETLYEMEPSVETAIHVARARLGKYDVPLEIRPRYAAHLARASDPVLVWLNLVQELVSAGERERAKSILADLPQERAEVVLHYAILDATEGRYEEALGRVDEALGLDATLAQAHLYRAFLLKNLGRDEELARLADVQLESSQHRALLAKERAMALLRLRRAEEALAATEVEVDERHWPILAAARAAALMLLGRTEEARLVAESGDGPGADRALLQAVLEQTR